jgi:hypothetical protein
MNRSAKDLEDMLVEQRENHYLFVAVYEIAKELEYSLFAVVPAEEG